ETNDIVLIDKRRRSGRRIQDPSQLGEVFEALGSNLNPILTQLAKTRRALFVEGKDFQILGRFARKLGADAVANRRDFAVVPVEGFNPERIRSLKSGMETTLGRAIAPAAVLDKDYRSDGEREALIADCGAFCRYATIHKCKEIENFLWCHRPSIVLPNGALLIRQGVEEQAASIHQARLPASVLLPRRRELTFWANTLGNGDASHEVLLQIWRDATISEAAITEFETCWATETSRLQVIPGKDALRTVNQYLQDQYGINVTPAGIVDAMRRDEVPAEMVELIRHIADFAASKVD